jgi:hypothetical protein
MAKRYGIGIYVCWASAPANVGEYSATPTCVAGIASPTIPGANVGEYSATLEWKRLLKTEIIAPSLVIPAMRQCIHRQ